MPHQPTCECCDLTELCMLGQRENYRLRDLVYPFARLECEPQAECEPLADDGSPAPGVPDARPAGRRRSEAADELAERILDCLAGADEPLTQAAIAGALNMTGPADYVRVKNMLYKLKQAGQIRTLQDRKKRPGKGKPPNLWVLG